MSAPTSLAAFFRHSRASGNLGFSSTCPASHAFAGTTEIIAACDEHVPGCRQGNARFLVVASARVRNTSTNATRYWSDRRWGNCGCDLWGYDRQRPGVIEIDLSPCAGFPGRHESARQAHRRRNERRSFRWAAGSRPYIVNFLSVPATRRRRNLLPGRSDRRNMAAITARPWGISAKGLGLGHG
jgi:hypothetical protein